MIYFAFYITIWFLFGVIQSTTALAWWQKESVLWLSWKNKPTQGSCYTTPSRRLNKTARKSLIPLCGKRKPLQTWEGSVDLNFFMHLWGYKTLIIQQNDNISPPTPLCTKKCLAAGTMMIHKAEMVKVQMFTLAHEQFWPHMRENRF